MSFRPLGLLLFLLLTVDFCNASTPGVFYFGSDQLFVDAAVEPKGTAGVDAEWAPVTDVPVVVEHPISNEQPTRSSQHHLLSPRPVTPFVRPFASRLTSASAGSATPSEDH